ncbi:hypothetical protein [Bradyrhizobium sp. RDI18]
MIIQAIARAWGRPSLPDWNCVDAAPMPISDQQTPNPNEIRRENELCSQE